VDETTLTRGNGCLSRSTAPRRALSSRVKLQAVAATRVAPWGVGGASGRLRGQIGVIVGVYSPANVNRLPLLGVAPTPSRPHRTPTAARSRTLRIPGSSRMRATEFAYPGEVAGESGEGHARYGRRVGALSLIRGQNRAIIATPWRWASVASCYAATPTNGRSPSSCAELLRRVGTTGTCDNDQDLGM
jgi:hypothetical protein